MPGAVRESGKPLLGHGQKGPYVAVGEAEKTGRPGFQRWGNARVCLFVRLFFKQTTAAQAGKEKAGFPRPFVPSFWGYFSMRKASAYITASLCAFTWLC